MPIIHVSLAFANLSDAGLDEFASNVVIKMTGNALFTTPVVSMATLGAAQVAFHAALAAMTQGGTQATAAKNAARATLVGLLRQQANYVQGIANNNEVTLLSSGFERTSPNTGQSPLTAPVIEKITNVASTQLGIKMRADANSKAIEIQGKTAGATYAHLGTFTGVRGIVLANLTPGLTYELQARGVGGSTGHSPWSDPVSHMAT